MHPSGASQCKPVHSSSAFYSSSDSSRLQRGLTRLDYYLTSMTPSQDCSICRFHLEIAFNWSISMFEFLAWWSDYFLEAAHHCHFQRRKLGESQFCKDCWRGVFEYFQSRWQHLFALKGASKTAWYGLIYCIEFTKIQSRKFPIPKFQNGFSQFSFGPQHQNCGSEPQTSWCNISTRWMDVIWQDQQRITVFNRFGANYI